MFGFSLQKLLVLAVIVVAIWYAFKFISQLDRRRKRALKATRQGTGDAAAGGVPRAEEMVQCPVCQAYVAAQGAANCGREDCPY
ncbi:MAG: hypothetical protein ACE5JZ_02540 [Kiloniellales bacterium]